MAASRIPERSWEGEISDLLHFYFGYIEKEKVKKHFKSRGFKEYARATAL